MSICALVSISVGSVSIWLWLVTAMVTFCSSLLLIVSGELSDFDLVLMVLSDIYGLCLF